MKLVRNNTLTTLALYDVSMYIKPGQIVNIGDDVFEKSAHLHIFLSRGLAEVVDETAKPIPVPSVVTPNGVVSEVDKENRESRLILEDGVTPKRVMPQNDGTVVVKGTGEPGTGAEKPMAQVIEEKSKEVTEAIAAVVGPTVVSPAPKLAEADPNTAVVASPDLPADIVLWGQLSLNDKKGKLLAMADASQLAYIGGYDKDPVVQKLISQRIQEIKGA